jgi:hypothetical protein
VRSVDRVLSVLAAGAAGLLAGVGVAKLSALAGCG